MALPKNVDEDVITSARLAWNKISAVMDKEEPSYYSKNEDFLPFYKELVVNLFADHDKE